jgi:hypothetical protein
MAVILVPDPQDRRYPPYLIPRSGSALGEELCESWIAVQRIEPGICVHVGNPTRAGTASIVSIQYREGMVDSLARTLAERDAIAGALAANRALMQQRQAVVGVYRALGGGWE